MDMDGPDIIDEMLFDLRALFKNMPIRIEKEPRYQGDTIVAIAHESLFEQYNLTYWAEYLRMHGRDAARITAIRLKMRELEEGYGIMIEGSVQADFYLKLLHGEMAFQDAFPRRAPNWYLYHVDSGVTQR